MYTIVGASPKASGTRGFWTRVVALEDGGEGREGAFAWASGAEASGERGAGCFMSGAQRTRRVLCHRASREAWPDAGPAAGPDSA
ncbi:hypothetical protein BE18_33430 [Sorangium cellulosum]|uniref:Uncharacterized protein n=1 Tax=Sorangium cellulosum TaxID=56 RepID=A0A150T8E7_SORCE|nr:hypothetical protein BE18_33430 [Sorangium cellulosum]